LNNYKPRYWIMESKIREYNFIFLWNKETRITIKLFFYANYESNKYIMFQKCISLNKTEIIINLEKNKTNS